ncbi:hypothetical protein [Mycobacteroides franklinii]|uniref:hypothetical protein n=1 Tax=Mycobacteroides franklinii TaxID=948102 RepID=UPI0012FF7340|nr:hypothetical protein [Mycobacteroides franklinii]
MSDPDDETFDEEVSEANFAIACEALAEVAVSRWGLIERSDGLRVAVPFALDDLIIDMPLPADEIRAMATTERMLDTLLIEWARMPMAPTEMPPGLYAEARRAAKVRPATKPAHPIPEGADWDEWLDDLQELHFHPARDALATEAARLWEPTFSWETVCDGDACFHDLNATQFTYAVADVVRELDLARPLLRRDIRDIATRPEVLKALVKRWMTYESFLESAPPEALWLAFVDDLDPEVLEHFTVDGEPIKKLLAVTLKDNPYADRYAELMD